jgi:hypothetical protein
MRERRIAMTTKAKDLPGCCPQCGSPLAFCEAEKFHPTRRDIFVPVTVVACGSCEYIRDATARPPAR